MQKFVHLRLHTEFSITDSILRVQNAVDIAVANNMVALGISDLHNMFALVKFYKECHSKGIKPIIGSDVMVENSTAQSYRLLIIAKNLSGYRYLCELITRSFIENKVKDVAHIRESWLLDNPSPDIIILSGGVYGDIYQLVEQNKKEEAIIKAQLWQSKFTNNYFLELQRFSYPKINEYIELALHLAQNHNIPVVATHPIQFAKKDDYTPHEIRVRVASSQLLDDQTCISQFTPEQYMLSQAEMTELFRDIPSSIANTEYIATICNLEITLGKYFLPDFVPSDGSELNDYLVKQSIDGLDRRIIELFPEDSEREQNYPIYRARLDLEIQTIIEMGFPGYFLIVADFINWAKNNNIPVGPGRGSGAGSIVAFSLGITDVDPIRYSLLFERFLNPERVSMPDFDIDFCQEKRELVIEYVKNKYGAHAVSQIATFGTMSSKAVIKDVGRVLGLPYGLCDSISKLILNTPAKSYSLEESYQEFPELKERIDNADDELRRLWDMSRELEDLTRNVGKHAAGVLIAPSDLSNFCPLYIADGMQTSQLDKDDVESIGLVKFDFLGLRNLTIIQETLDNIDKLTNTRIKLSNFDFSDNGVYELLQEGNTTAIFQLESQGMKRLLVKLEPDRFEDIIAVLALYRPGPLGSGMVDDFVKRKKGEDEINYFHPDLTECLAPTYGVIVYQEQVMQISQIIGGYTLGGADLLRRAMGKKKPEEMAKHRELFVNGALDKGYTSDLAENLFDLMAKFAEYGFNKSHTAAYAVISYHTAYLKKHYAACFMAATLSSEADRTDKLYEFYQDCIDNGLEIIHPDINLSHYRFVAINDKQVIYALGAIKGIGQHVAEMIAAERAANGEFTGLVDFCTRIDKKALNKKSLESLIKAGCFDKLEPNRAMLLHNLANIIEQVSTYKDNANQISLFDDIFSDGEQSVSLSQLDIKLETYPEFTLKEQLTNEKSALGYYLTASLFDDYKYIVRQLEVLPLASFAHGSSKYEQLVNRGFSKEKETVIVSGIINYMGSRATKKGGKISFINIEDDTADLEFVVFDKEYATYKHLLKMDEFVIVKGELIYDSFRDQVKINVSNMYSLNELITARLDKVELELSYLDNVKNLLNVLQHKEINQGNKLIINYQAQSSNGKIVASNTYNFDYECFVNVSNVIAAKQIKFRLNDMVNDNNLGFGN